MAAPTYGGLTQISNFASGSGTLTGTASGNSYAQIETPSEPLDGSSLGVYFVLSLPTGANFAGCRVQPGSVGSSNPQNFSTSKLIIHFKEFDPGGGTYGSLDTRANRGFVFRLYSDAGFTVYREWLIFGSDSNWSILYKRNSSKWFSLIIDATDSTLANTTSGSFNASTIYAFEIRTTYTSQDRHSFSIDKWLASAGITITGGDSITPGNFAGVATYTDTTTKAFLTYQIDQSFLMRMPALIGNGSTTTYWDVVDQAIQFVPLDGTSANPQIYILPDDFLGIVINQAATDYYRSLRCLYASANKWQLTISGSTSATFIWQGGSISNLGTNSLGGAASFNNVTFANCDRLNPSANRSFINCTITSSTDLVAAFDWDGTQTITGCSFISNTIPAGVIRINAAGTYTLSSNTFSGNTKLFNVTATTGTVTIVQDSGTTFDVAFNSSCYVTAGATVVLVPYIPSIQIQVTGAPAGSSIGVFKRSSSKIADRAQFTLTSGNNSGNSTLVLSSTLPNDTPSAGYVRVIRNDGQTEDRLRYASWSDATLTLYSGVTLPTSYSAGNGCYIGYLDVLNSASGTETNTIQYVADRDCVLTIRKGAGTGKIQDIRLNLTIQNQDAIIPASGVLDTINER